MCLATHESSSLYSFQGSVSETIASQSNAVASNCERTFVPSRLNSAGKTLSLQASGHTIEMIDRLLGLQLMSVVDLRFLYAGAIARAIRRHVLLRKEVIQPHLPIRLPCYDFVPLT